MHESRNSFISHSFLRSVWSVEYEAFRESVDEQRLLSRLQEWAERKDLKETSAESAFIEVFFVSLWGYAQTGQSSGADGYSLYPKYSIKNAGQSGGTGEADLVAGYFERDGTPDTPQVVCEFKSIGTDLDAPQKSRKTNNRSPVKQCLDYLSATRRGLFGNEPVLPTWGIVTDMNEFRLYWYDRAPGQYLRFVIKPSDLFQEQSLLATDEQARFQRFLFWKIFHRDTLLSTGGGSLLAQLITHQWVREKELETTFYKEYRAFRTRLYDTLVELNPDFPGTRGRLVRLAQKILDRCIFIFFCEDMGQAISFPPQLLRDFLIHESQDKYLEPGADTIWRRMISLFKSMNDGMAFGGKAINQFNGGLFADDTELENLFIPNTIFCYPGQGQDEASLNDWKQTILYLSAAYNYASDFAKGLQALPSGESVSDADAIKHDPSKNLGLYTLGRIFEQSVTELEILEAEADGVRSVNQESKRKRDGVFYTPEWVVEKIVTETLDPLLTGLKHDCGWPENGHPTPEALESYRERLKTIKVLDPACGSGAFLITALRYLLDEWHVLQALRREMTGDKMVRDDDALVRDILSQNIYGVDINPASVEIARLALWLHTASGDNPLSTLDKTIRDGNSLIDGTFYKGQIDLEFYDDVQKERVNVFEWHDMFPEVFNNGGFDAIVGNPPYVKLQNFRNVHADMAEYLKDGRTGEPKYKSTQTGSFDLYLPFIEKSLGLLNAQGRMGFIAPSIWTVNDYGAGLRSLLQTTGQLERWIDFKSFQVFAEATTYTALQFYTKQRNNEVKVVSCPDGRIPDQPWSGKGNALPYKNLEFNNQWLLLTGKERRLIDRLDQSCKRLDDPAHTENIFVGIQTSADSIYHLKKIGPGKYLCQPKEKKADPREVEIEDAIMKPLVSGPQAKRYTTPKPDTYLLFPYDATNGTMSLIGATEFKKKYPKAWEYLRSHKKQLRYREAILNKNGKIKRDKKGIAEKAPFDNTEWYRFGRHQNLNKQEIPKLIIPRLVADLSCSYDAKGGIYLDNVDVGGVSVAEDENAYFLAALLNAPVANFVFKRISKPFRGEYRSANKQFIAPLPIPSARDADKTAVAGYAKKLQELHSRRRDLLADLERRLTATKRKCQPITFLFPAIQSIADLLNAAPSNLDRATKRKWAKAKHEQAIQARYDAITTRLYPGVVLDAQFEQGELRFLVDGIAVIDRIFLDDEQGIFILAQWKIIASTFSVAEKTTGTRLCNTLRKLAETDNKALIKQALDRQTELEATEAKITKTEKAVNALIYKIYGLTPEEIQLVERDLPEPLKT